MSKRMTRPRKQEFTVTTPRLALVWLLPGASLLAALVATLLAMRQGGQAWLGLAVLLPVTALVACSIHRRKVVLQDGVLRIAAGLHTTSVPVASLDLAHARVGEVDEHGELRPGPRAFGISTPGLQAGHFRISGGRRSFALLTDHRRVFVAAGAFRPPAAAQPGQTTGAVAGVARGRAEALIDAMGVPDPRVSHVLPAKPADPACANLS